MTPDDTGHDRWDELAVGHALNALDPADEEAFLAHQAGCPLCATHVAEAHEVAAELAYALPTPDPPPALRAAIRRVPLGSPVQAPGRQPSQAPPGPTPTVRFPGAAEQPPGPAPVRRPRPATRWLAAAAVALIAVGGLAGWGLARGTAEPRPVLTAAQRAVLDCVNTAGCSVVRLAPPDGGAPVATALVSGDRVRVAVTGLPANPRGTVYVLWQQQGPGMLAVDAFDVSARGAVIDAGRLPTPFQGRGALAISHEHGRKAPATPSEPVAIGTVAT